MSISFLLVPILLLAALISIMQPNYNLKSRTIFAGFLTCFASAIAVAISFYSIQFTYNGFEAFFSASKWFSDWTYLLVEWDFRLDILTSIMLIAVTGVSALVHCYSINYMSTDPLLSKFMGFLSLFTCFMVILIQSSSLVVLFLGWEGVGICSFLLISFWSTRANASKSAVKAMVVNRIGDVCFLAAICLVANDTHSTVFEVLFSYYLFSFNSLVPIFFLIAAIAKSAQLGLQTWLPDAMEGPTPVSALIHAATMVTAGVFLIIRLAVIFNLSSNISLIIIIIGSITALLAAAIGAFQKDIKKVIAYSTCSQLGYMFASCGLNEYAAAIFHLYTHAFFKALLFLSAGVIIHVISNEQDTRRLGAFISISPLTYISFLIGSLSLMGIPFLSGYYSKDFIIESSYIFGSFFYIILAVAAIFTVYYSINNIRRVFLGSTKSFFLSILHIHSLTSIELFVLTTLSVASIFSGYLSRDLVLFTVLDSSINVEFIPLIIKNIPILIVIVGTYFACYNIKYPFTLKLFFKRSGMFDIYYSAISQSSLLFGRTVFNIVERHLLKT